MLIKEYRIPLPLSVDEYKVAQLYMIAKKSREETQGAGSGVEILVNEPYENGPSGSRNGQYTRKIYHVGQHLPGWLKTLLPKSALTVEEEAWNAYPYTKTRYTCPFVEKFFIEIETKYLNDCGQQENVFDLSSSDLRNRAVDVIDIVKDQLVGSDYVKDEDPRFYVSEKTGRGPLNDDWIEEHWRCQNNGDKTKAIMCAYKLCRVEFKYWGMQSKIEKFIHDSALRRVMLRAHRQAWAWQDEWFGLTMDDIRKLEKETQEMLARKMAKLSEDEDNENSNLDNKQGTVSNSCSSGHISQTVDLNVIDKDKDEEFQTLSMAMPKNKNISSTSNTISNTTTDQTTTTFSEKTEPRRKHWSRSNSRAGLHSPSGGSIQNFDIQLVNWRMGSIANESDSNSDEEFYDAEEILDNISLTKWSSLECIPIEESQSTPEVLDSEDSIFSSSFIHRMQVEHSRQHVATLMARGSVDASLPNSPTASPNHKTSCSTTTLIMVLHGGNILESGAEPLSSKKSDFTTFRGAFESVLRQHYASLIGKISFRLVPCSAICADALAVLSSLSPYSFQSSPSAIDGVSHTYDSVPLGALPLFAISSHEYTETITKMVSLTNQIYQDFLKSEEGSCFNGQVVLVGDSIGSIIVFDALCRSNQLNNNSHHGSEASITEVSEQQALLQTKPKQNPLISLNDNGGNIEIGDKGENKKPCEKQAELETMNETSNFYRLLCAPQSRRRSSGSSDQTSSLKFDFDVSHFFMFGSPLGLVLTFRKMVSNDEKMIYCKPNCSQVYNLFHPMDPTVLRVEPLLSARFAHVPPVNVPRFQKFPLDSDQPVNLIEAVQNYSHIFMENLQNTSHTQNIRRMSEISVTSNVDVRSSPFVASLIQRWWGSKRLDYAVYCPDGLTNFPTHSLPHLFHASYWESSDVISFIIRQLLRSADSRKSVVHEAEKDPSSLLQSHSREKWLKKRTSMKLKVGGNINANHRANDVLVKEGADQVISARFMYGPLDVVALTGEKVDIHIMKDMLSCEWSYLTTEVTDKNGRVSYTIPSEKALGLGVYPVKMVVRGDRTSIDFFLTVVPPKTECVVFSIDGSFTASVSVTGRDPKVRAGAVDVVRHWQELGYLIIYITGRPDMQQHRVISWLSQHNFPHGLVSFADKLSTDPLKHKMEYLKMLQTNADVIFHAAYGSSKDIWVYQSLGLNPEQIFIVGKVSKKQQSMANVLSDGYAAHLAKLNSFGGSRPAKGNARMILPRGCFGLLGHGGFPGVRQRKSAKRTTSYPLTSNTATITQTTASSSGTTETNTFSNFFSNRPGSSKSK